uniref:RRM domain-containing protein n=1 Tax=Coccidioides posadasii RMSCC 3488 TaxID=454284 RepID=A0A0J6I2E4_COCPO|nr:hypothetical protein CPAG_01852 [Coccidioides posadasii RMSCC 3488]
MAPERTGKSVFLGNIPYTLTEEQVKDILSSAGTVTKFRLMINPETGKPKGYGFADFADADAAASAVRNLNDYEIMGRKIRVDWPHNNEKDSVPLDYSQQGQASAAGPRWTTRIPGTSSSIAISSARYRLASESHMSECDLPDLINASCASAARFVADPARATELLRQAPQLAYAIFQALLLMNLVDYSTLGAVVEQATQPQPPAPQAQPASHIPPQFQPYPPIPGQVSTPPIHSTPFAPPPPPQPQPQTQPPLQAQIPGQEELLQQVLSMPQATIDALPPAERSQIMLLRQQLLQGGMR